ncbi:hypothetical protein BRADI_1g08363v3 [Brachypodium distachyon]|uniref:Uncharacterized protein n=1 Tax=Brachypodium distachyon TaxID=15368 RepID=A0A2K2DIM2_BRADI|nr:hypothetical protein BRADI_1g08363v3 [Brachypodium distachyon]
MAHGCLLLLSSQPWPPSFTPSDPATPSLSIAFLMASRWMATMRVLVNYRCGGWPSKEMAHLLRVLASPWRPLPFSCRGGCLMMLVVAPVGSHRVTMFMWAAQLLLEIACPVSVRFLVARYQHVLFNFALLIQFTFVI